ncbi:helix-turn-helix domain-containing protein [Corynebacterium hindlerae]|uniref:helix-turn-helix domain-containing protein n=1 Tax=Corynebacterium hindlerae TaxID=699041 RepID=UPI003AAB2721
MANELAASIGAAVKRLRGQRGMSATDLARRAGVSKATLSQLESGTGNPTVSTLDSLAVTLGVPLGDLIERNDVGQDTYVPARDFPDDAPHHHLIHRIPLPGGPEVWVFALPPHTTFSGVPHSAGTMESFFVLSGEVLVRTSAQNHKLSVGDYVSFDGQQPHSYQTEQQAASMLVLLSSAR